jgi:AbrB family looped-hinge helix DNA binding protein
MESSSFKARINEQGRIVIPAEIRRKMDLKPEDTVLMDFEDGVLKIESYRARIRRIQKEFAHLAPPGTRVSDELIAERRWEALLEQQDFERAREMRRIRDGFGSAKGPSAEESAATGTKPEDHVA